MSGKLTDGATYEVWHPFRQEVVNLQDEEGGYSSETWVPGWRTVEVGPEDDHEEQWDGEGAELRTVISIHRPGKYPTRIFYVRQWRNPDGRVFGRNNLRCTTQQAFTRWISGARWQPRSRVGIEARLRIAGRQALSPVTGGKDE